MQVIEINKEILLEKDKLFMGLNTRETLCAALGIAVTAGSYFLLSSSGLGIQGGSWIGILAGIPFFAFGFYKKNGMTLEKYLGVVIRSKFTVPLKRPVSYPNTHYELLKDIGKEENNGKNTTA